MANIIEVKVPDIGDFKNVEIIELHVKKGDVIKVDDPIISLESDKATMEIPSSAAGKVTELKVKPGDKVSKGTLVLLLESAEAAAAKPAAAPAPKEDKPAPAATPAPAAAPAKPAPAPAAAAPTIQEQEIKVPDIGDFKQVEVVDVLVKVGDKVSVESPLIALESDKATMEIPSPHAGTIKKILVKTGDKVSKGTTIALIDAVMGGATAPAPVQESAPAAAPAAAPAPAAPAPARSETSNGGPARIHESDDYRATGLVHASPAIRMFARELGVNLSRVKGSGRKGRILREDVTAFTRAVMSGDQSSGTGKNITSLFEIPAVDFSKFGATESVALSKLNKLSAQNLHRAWVSIPHVTHFEEADITDMEAYRASKKAEAEKHGTKLTPLSFLIKAAVVALKKHPRFNASLAPNGEELILKKYYHIGIAVNTEQGLVVPVVKDADKKGMYDLAKELATLAQKARDRKLPPSDMQGACFTISSLGHIGGTGFTPIINPPEVAIMGVSKSSMKPVYKKDKFEPRLILPFSISYDHRVIDGVAAAEFAKTLAESLTDIRELLL